MTKRANRPKFIMFASWIGLSLTVPGLLADEDDGGLEIKSATVDGRTLHISANESVNLEASPQNIVFNFGPGTNSRDAPLRVRYELKGYENDWHDEGTEMDLTIRFFNDVGDIVSQRTFPVYNESAGWTGSFVTAPLIHRREMLVVPRRASKLMVVISSAGPPNAVGMYVVADLVVTISSDNSPSLVLLESPLGLRSSSHIIYQAPDGWMRDGIHPSMAHIVEIGQHPATRAFAILDDDRIGHAEWHNILDVAPTVKPGEHLVVEWNEMYSIGDGNYGTATYASLAPGRYSFRVQGTDIMGNPTGVETALQIIVPEPYWVMPWFWGTAFLVITASLFGVNRYIVWRRMRLEMVRLKNRQALEHERLRIAHDIHDDLGARVTQISLLSAMSHDNPDFPEKARAEFDRLSQMSRELVSALYQTVWAVNPENDNLDALGNYLCQMVHRMCEQVHFRCRFDIADLPREISISSQTRHNISLAVKEAVHNAIKHAKASEIFIRVTFKENLLTVSVQDNGRGFRPRESLPGHGLNNMKRRMEDVGGSCVVESEPGHGTMVHFHLTVQASSKSA